MTILKNTIASSSIEPSYFFDEKMKTLCENSAKFAAIFNEMFWLSLM